MIRYDDVNAGDELACQCELISTCCGAPPLGELDNVPDDCPPTGICSKCRDHAAFEKDLEDES
jgi:hypothetical protein